MKMIFIRALVFLLTAAPVMWFGADPASANFHTDTYQYLVGTETDGVPLCGLEPNACPVISEDNHLFDGEMVELTGEGTFRVSPRLVTGGGTIIHKTAAGEVISQSRWTADRLLAFVPYGCGGEGLPDNFCGGLTMLRITIDPADPTGPMTSAILFINCLIGPHPEGQQEGIKLLVPHFGAWFSHEVSGLTLFIKQGLAV